MKKLILVYLLLFFSVSILFAQRNLELREKTEALSVFTDKDPVIDSSGGIQAGVIISCSNALQLNFSSNVDKAVDVYKKEEKGGSRFYYLRFIIGKYKGASYDNRVLEVSAQNFLPLKLNLDLKPSESKWYEIYDPNATVGVGCFYQYYNEGVELFKKALYQEAQEKYKLSMECNDAPPDLNVKEKIANIDSILSLRKTGDYYFDMLHFKEASNCYQKIISYNKDDQYAIMRNNESNIKLMDNCNNYFNNAEDYFTNGKYDEAKKLYEFVLQQSCPKSIEANTRLTEINNHLRDRKQRAQVIMYEFGLGSGIPKTPNTLNSPNTPIGISVGKYKEGKVSGYFSIRMNPEIFKAIQQNSDTTARPELNISFGWTIKVYKPVWIFFGPGYTGVGEWYNGIDKKRNFRIDNAISPEIGLLGKIGPVALRYTFQYRLALGTRDNENNDIYTKNDATLPIRNYIGYVSNVLGIGFCF